VELLGKAAEGRQQALQPRPWRGFTEQQRPNRNMIACLARSSQGKLCERFQALRSNRPFVSFT
jgi:hypothetical protein